MARTIILGYDGSQCAKDALDAAVDLARDKPDGRIIVVHANPVPLPLSVGGRMPPGVVMAEAEERQERAKIELAPLLEEATSRVAAAGVPVESRIEWESPAYALLDVAQREQADMIVVGSHGYGAIRGSLLGSTPIKLLHLSRFPVVIVPHPQK